MGCGASTGPPAELWKDLPSPFNTKIDAVIWNGVDGSNRVDYIFSGDQVLEYNVWTYAEQRTKAAPVPVAQHQIFGKLPLPFNTKIDAVIWNGVDGSNRVDYIFSGDQVLEYTVWTYAEQRMKAAPVPIAQHHILGKLPSPFNTKIDAVIWNIVDVSGRVDYIFSGDQVLEYTVWTYAEQRMKAAPVPIAQHHILGKLPSPFNTKIDAVIWNIVDVSGRVDYIFSGDQVLQYTVWKHAQQRLKSPAVPMIVQPTV